MTASDEDANANSDSRPAVRTTINSDAESTGMLEQRRLPNARVTPKHQDAALPSSSVGEQSIGLSELE